ncbi:MAG: RNA methyltransferase [Gallionella sp.]
MRLAPLQQRLQALGCKPCHADRLLRGWLQIASYDRVHSPAENFFPLALRNELPTLEAELNGLARLRSEHPAVGHKNHDQSPTLTLPRKTGEGTNAALRESANNAGVSRLLVALHDGQMVESVLLPRGGLCISTQVGCAVGCVFCMSGRAGLIRQLDSLEIVAQVVLARRHRAVSKVVFMGMGEPAHNLDNVLEAIALLGTQGNIGHKNLVLSTVGDERVFERLAQHLVKPALAISLHSTDATLRAQLLPNAPPMSIEELIAHGEIYARATGYPVQYQWTLIAGVNDSDAEIAGIARLLKDKYAMMNFIPFNAVDGLNFQRPSIERTEAMVTMLKQHGILARIRDSAGQEIEGACGQLRARAEKQNRSKKVSFTSSVEVAVPAANSME